jgi:hypothetical protein
MYLQDVAYQLESIGPNVRMSIRIRDGEAIVSVRDESVGYWPTLLAKAYSNSIELAVSEALEHAKAANGG